MKEMPVPNEIPVPKELEILLPELNKGVIVIGSKAFEMFPLVEGQFERIISGFVNVMEKVNCPDGQCPKCGKVVKGALPKKIFKCPEDGENLLTMNQSEMEAIIGSGKVPEWVEMITGIPRDIVQEEMTLPQMRHFAGLFWKQNISDEGLPEVSKENFKKLLGMMKPEEKASAPAAEKKEDKPQV